MIEDLTKIILLSSTDNIKMERYIVFCEHLGILAGGGWGEGQATIFMDPHLKGCGCSSSIPHIKEISTEVLDIIKSWCANNDIIVEDIMTSAEYDQYDLNEMAEELATD